MVDAQRLQDYAEKHGHEWRWKTLEIEDGWKALAQIKLKNGDTSPIFSSWGATEQAALDRAVEFAIDHSEWRGRKDGITARKGWKI